MARRYVFPDPNDRSPNEPQKIVSKEQVLGLYKQSTGEKMKRVTKKVQDWFCARARAYNWDTAAFSGSQCTLGVELQKREIPEDLDDNP